MSLLPSSNQNKFDLDRLFASFLQNTDEKEQMIRAMRPVFSKLKQHNHWNNKTNIKILDIGCGSGLTTAKFFALINDFFPDLTITVNAIDNNLKSLSDYATKFSSNNNIQVIPHNIDIFSTTLPTQDADLILAAHTLYYTPLHQLNSIMLSIYKAMASKGIAVISSLDDQADFAIIQKQFNCYNASSNGIKPVSVTLNDINKLLKNTPLFATNTITVPYDAHIYFPQLPGGFKEFKTWQINAPQNPPPNFECSLTMDLLEFILQGNFDNLRKIQKLELFLQTIEKMFEKNGLDAEGRYRLNTNGKNIFILGANIDHSLYFLL